MADDALAVDPDDGLLAAPSEALSSMNLLKLSAADLVPDWTLVARWVAVERAWAVNSDSAICLVYR